MSEALVIVIVGVLVVFCIVSSYFAFNRTKKRSSSSKKTTTKKIRQIDLSEQAASREIHHRVRYWKKMQKGKEYPFTVFLSNLKELLGPIYHKTQNDEILTIIERTTLPQNVKNEFFIRVSSPGMEICPNIRKILLSKQDMVQQIEFRTVPNYCGDFEIKLEFFYQDISFCEENYKTKVQKSGFQIKKLQISSSLIGFFSIFISIGSIIQPLLPFDILNFLFYYGVVLSISFLGFLFYNLGLGNNLIQVVRIEFSSTTTMETIYSMEKEIEYPKDMKR